MTKEASTPLRLLMIDNATAFGGTLTVVRNLARHLDQSTVEVTIITACKEPFLDAVGQSRATVYFCRPYAHYQRISQWNTSVRKWIGVNILSKCLGRLFSAFSLVANVPYSLYVAIVCIKSRPHVVHYNQVSIEAFWATRILRRKAILHLHGLYPNPLPRRGARVISHMHAYISISKCVHTAAIQAGMSPEIIHRIPNFVERSPASNPTPLPAAPTIGIFGRVIPWKGQKEFLSAARIVMQRNPEVRALVVGDAADWGSVYFDECVRTVHEWGLSDRIEFTGMVRDVASYYRRCSVVVHASIEPEPFGMVIIEAMAEGRPIVASSYGAAAEIVLESGSGLVANPRDAEDLAENILRLIGNREIAEEMGRRGFQEVQRRYDPKVVVRSFERFYRSISLGQYYHRG